MTSFFKLLLFLVYVAVVSPELVRGQPPNFAPSNVFSQLHVNENEPLSLKCDAQNANEIIWHRNNENTGIRTNIYFIEAAQRNDSAEYRCLAKNSMGSVFSVGTNVTIEYFDDFDELSTIYSAESSIDGFFLLRRPLLIASSGLPVEYSWLKDEEKVVADGSHYVTSRGDLIVTNVKQSDFGSYKVIASTISFGDVMSKDFQVVEGSSNGNDVPFTIVVSPTDRTVLLQEGPLNETFDCVTSFSSDYKINWFIDGIPITSNTVGVRLSQNNRKLTFINASGFESFGKGVHTLQCKASARTGRLFDESESFLNIISVPTFQNSFSQIQKPMGSSVSIRCSSDDPHTEIRWFFNGNKIPAKGRSLSVPATSSSNYGIYQCEARNEAGVAFQTSWLKEGESNPEGTPAFDERIVEGGTREEEFEPIITIGPDSTTVPVNSASFSLKCAADGNPKPSLLWKFEDDLIPNDTVKYEVSSSGELVVHNIKPSDAGVYKCVARNNLGTKEKTAFISVSGDKMIFRAPTDQSMLIGTSLDIPCEVHKDFRQDAVVSWFFNDEEITNSGNTALRLSINGKGGLHIGQVGPDSIGEYKCVVTSGSKVESASMLLEIIEKPSMPTAVSATLVNDTLPAKIRVEWNEGFDGNAAIIRYMIQMRTVGPTDLWSDWETVGETDPAESCCSYLLDNLKPSVTAEFRVIASNKHGPGKPSLPSSNVTMPQQPPAAAPKNVAASARSANSIIVQWQKPQDEQFSGDILGYVIRYRLAGYTLPWTEKNVTTRDARNAIIDQLITWQEYEIQVAAYNERGLGVFSKNILVTTAEGVPTQAPKHVKVKVINSTAVSVSFTAPDQQRIPGVNLGYKAQFWKNTSGKDSLFLQVLVDPIPRVLSTVVEGLEKFGHYNLTVLCFTAPGDGPKSSPVQVITMEDTPSAVSSLTVQDVMFDAATVSWNPPLQSNGIITRYVLRYWNDLTPEAKTSVELKGNQDSAVINGLQPSTKYSVDIFASTSVGDGPRDESKFESGRPPILPEKPTSLSISDIKARSVHLSFIPGHDGYTAIKQWLVEARIADSGIYSNIFNISAPKAKSFVVTGLRPYTQYQIRLIAVNVKGRGMPSEPTKIFETKQTNPETPASALFAEPVSASTISLSWTPLLATQWNGQPKGYLVLYRIKDDEDWKEIRTSSLRASDFSLTGLVPFTTYEVELFAENMHGRSSSTGVVTARTYESTPSGSPKNIRAESEGLRTAVIRWSEVSEEERNGDILGYTVRLVPKEEWLRSDETRKADVPGGVIMMTRIAGLRAYTEYEVFVSAYTIVGNGPDNSQPAILLTDEDLPGPPSGVGFSVVSEDEVRLKWSPPKNPNGKIKEYVVTHFVTAEGAAASHRVTVPSLGTFSATDLKQNTRYTFTIAAVNAIGTGPEAQVEVYTSSVRMPVPIPPVPVRDERATHSPTQVSIHWDYSVNSKNSEVDEPPVRSIQVEYQKANENGWTNFERGIPSDKTGITVNRLIPNTPYRFRIRFMGDFESSPWSSESEWLKTLPAAPSAIPTKISIVPYDSSSILLEWTTPDRSFWNSDSIGYHISYKEYPSNESWRSDDLPARSERQESEQYILPKLASFRHYIVRMSAYNSEGDGPFSSPLFVYVGYSIPKRNVTGLTAEPRSSSSIAVKWDAWDEDESDVISGFKVRFVPLTSVLSTAPDEEVLAVEGNNCILTDLKKFSEYQISVSAYNRAGEGGTSAVRVRTLEDVPGPVNHMRFSDVLLNSVKVVWDKPLSPNGIVTKYTVNYKSTGEKTDFKNEIQTSTDQTYLFATNLREGSEYIFTVWAETSAGQGTEATSNVTIGPNPNGPPSPSQPVVLPGQSSVTLSWKDPPNQRIVGHLIQVKRLSVISFPTSTLIQRRHKRSVVHQLSHTMGEWVTLKNVDGTTSKYEISYRDLEPSSQYVFRVFARDESGIGIASPQSVELEVPAFIPEDPFYTSWWFIGLIAMSTFVIIVVVIAFLCVTGSQAKFKREKRNSVDSLQLADGNFVTFQMKGHRGMNRSRNDLMIRPGTTQSWLSDREPPAYGSVLGVDRESSANGGSVVNMYGLATDVMPPPPNQQAMQRLTALVGRDIRSAGSAYVSNQMHRGPGEPSEYGNRHDYGHRSEYGYGARSAYGTTPKPQNEYEEGDSFDEEDPSGDEADNINAGGDIASHYGQIDHYRDTWRRVRETEAVKSSVAESSKAPTESPCSDSTWPTQPAPALANGFSSFV